MFSINYKEFTIHGYTYKPDCHVSFNGKSHYYGSLHSAKMAVTNHIKTLKRNIAIRNAQTAPKSALF